MHNKKINLFKKGKGLDIEKVTFSFLNICDLTFCELAIGLRIPETAYDHCEIDEILRDINWFVTALNRPETAWIRFLRARYLCVLSFKVN